MYEVFCVKALFEYLDETKNASFTYLVSQEDNEKQKSHLSATKILAKLRKGTKVVNE